MMSTDEVASRSRVLILAPVGRDASLTRSLLDRAGIESLGCTDLDDLQRNLVAGAGAAVITEEALIGRDMSGLVEWIAQQPSWSDFPFVVLLELGASAEAVGQERDALLQSGNLTLLERPVGTATLVSAVRAALRARGRQYEVHDAIEALTVSERRYRTLAGARRHRGLDGQRAPLSHARRSAAAIGVDQSAGRPARLFQPPMGRIHRYP